MRRITNVQAFLLLQALQADVAVLVALHQRAASQRRLASPDSVAQGALEHELVSMPFRNLQQGSHVIGEDKVVWVDVDLHVLLRWLMLVQCLLYRIGLLR